MSGIKSGFLSLTGKQFIVTGGSEGIGLAIAQALNREGAKVIIASRSQEKLERAKSTFSDQAEVALIAADLASTHGRSILLEKAKTLTSLHGVVNNIGLADRGEFKDFDERRVLDQINVNLIASMEITRGLFESLKATRGSVLNISSVAAQTALPNRLWYGVAKAGLEHATKALAVEWGKHGVRVNGIAPWFIRTELTKKVLDGSDLSSRIVSMTPLGRLGQPDDIANAAVFLLSEKSSYITGQIITVDGGFTARSGL